MIKYMAKWREIYQVEVEKESDQCVWIKGRRQNKVGGYEQFFDTFDDAKNHLIEINQSEVNSHKARLKYAESELAKIQALTEVSK